MTTADAILQVQDLSVVYHSSRGPHTAVGDLNLTLRSGEFVSILGPSGCGKSTLLSVVAGLLPASRGRVMVSGEPVRRPRPDVGIVFQKPTLLPWRTVAGNVMVPIEALRRSPRDYAERCRDLLGLVGLAAFAEHYPDELSGGMQQRVSIARALIHDPALMLMDEPFGALDAMTRERMWLELQDIWLSSRKTVLFITHSIPEAVFLSDRVLVMASTPGRIVQEIVIDLPRPRAVQTMAEPRYAALCGDIRTMFLSRMEQGR
ncbi:Bicarbonate transport ATP-binding protein CmpD [Rhodoplanes serenus]|jgi:NitT/TauT family transport system ATP-binding protein|uniref:Bicarbonate transport ATP-binding protein CmpD n=1 Tax=Rhodoplanes serenus TaxID=200615 RepID=A0A447D045_9BRAD|nr:ABC transporter ATP-binding protein [Rhodoplanes serenus]MBI5113101.1 ABC transporter ATP-binding protein [Rhodovulum sp.]VCU10874.1 Bicarbonate transport ATP-binding protein CmpD [Rhodoplanes serenus]